MKQYFSTSVALCALGLLGSNVVWAQAATDVNCDGCVQSSDIATNGVRRSNIQNFSINTPKLNNFAVTSEKIKTGAVTESKIADGAVTPDKMNATDANENTRYGLGAFEYNTTGSFNTANGFYALRFNTGGVANTANGSNALNDNTTGYNNTGTGRHALNDNTIGSNNTALGAFAGLYYTTGDYNIVIGADNWGVADESYTTRLGDNAYQTRAFIGGIRGAATGVADAVNVVIDSSGQLGTVSSSRRYKEDIQDMGEVSGRLLDLRPVTFRYKEAYENGEKPLDYGLIAEEVAEVFPELVVYNEEGQPETVKYRLLSSMLLNELQKQYQVNNQQDIQLAEVVELRAQVAEMSQLKAQVAEMSQLKTQVAQLNQLVQQMAKLALPASELVATNTGE